MRLAVVSLAIVALLAGCGSTAHHFSGHPARSLATTCGSLPKGLEAKTYWLEPSDGIRLYAATAGDGPTALVLIHESGGAGLCGWLKTMRWLSAKGFRAVAINLRGYPPSWQAPSASDREYTPDIQAAVDAAHGLGAKRVFVMGASLGGAATVAAAPKLKDVAGVISLSGELELPDIDAIGAAPRIRQPFIVIGSQVDGYLDGAAAHRLYRAVGTKDKQVAVFPGSYHGWDLLDDAPYRQKVRALILGWISAHT